MGSLDVRNNAPEAGALAPQFHAVRRASRVLASDLTDADATVQSMPDASPAKWHLAHTSWFFESLILAPHFPGYRMFDERFGNCSSIPTTTRSASSIPRPMRGLLSRPSLDTVYEYRETSWKRQSGGC